MALWTVIVTGISVNAQVELSPVLDHRLVERGENQMVLVIHVGYGHHQQSLVLGGIAPRNRGVLVCAFSVGP